VTDVDGRYVVINVPSGSYDVRISLLGYQAIKFQDVVVSADLTTRLDAVLTVAPVSIGEVVVTAKRPVVDLARTSTLAIDVYLTPLLKRYLAGLRDAGLADAKSSPASAKARTEKREVMVSFAPKSIRHRH